jgi:hypothetical protein
MHPTVISLGVKRASLRSTQATVALVLLAAAAVNVGTGTSPLCPKAPRCSYCESTEHSSKKCDAKPDLRTLFLNLPGTMI